MASEIETTSTSAWTADASPIVLRATERVRLVFLPTVITNPANPDAGVRGVLCYQRKGATGQWQPSEAIQLSTLRAGEGVRLELRSSELLLLYQGLADLYAVAREHGVLSGTHLFIEAPKGALLEQILQTGSLDELLDDTSAGLLEAFVSWLGRQDTDDLAERLATASTELISFDAAIGVSRLKSFLSEYEANRSRADEPYWQDLLERHSWVISQVFAQPFVIIRGQAYVGGKGIDNRGGSVADFLYRNTVTDNAALVEIKTPQTLLLGGQMTSVGALYRNNAYNVSRELSGATQQLLANKDLLIRNFRQLVGDDEPNFRPFSPNAILIIGDTVNLPSNRTASSSFELYRNNLREVDVITFNELADKIRRLIDLLAATV